MLAVDERLLGQLIVRRYWRDDGDGVDVWRLDEVRRIGGDTGGRVGACHGGDRVGALIAGVHDLAVGLHREIADHVGPPIPVTDDAEFKHQVLPRSVQRCPEPSRSAPCWDTGRRRAEGAARRSGANTWSGLPAFETE